MEDEDVIIFMECGEREREDVNSSEAPFCSVHQGLDDFE